MVFRLLMIAMIANILIYTGFVGFENGWNLVPIFFRDIAAMTWPGQFNVDFMSFLLLSATWTLWRNNFSGLGLALAPFALFGGIMFLAPYLLLLTVRASGDMKIVLLGEKRAAEA